MMMEGKKVNSKDGYNANGKANENKLQEQNNNNSSAQQIAAMLGMDTRQQ